MSYKKKAEAFLSEYETLCKKYNMHISYEVYVDDQYYDDNISFEVEMSDEKIEEHIKDIRICNPWALEDEEE